jgi:hypothetical protein
MGKVYQPYTRKDFANDIDALKPIFYVSVAVGALVTGLVLSNDQMKKESTEVALANNIQLEPVIVQTGVEYEIK